MDLGQGGGLLGPDVPLTARQGGQEGTTQVLAEDRVGGSGAPDTPQQRRAERAPRRGQAEEDKEDKEGQFPGPAKAGPVHMGLTQGLAKVTAQNQPGRHAAQGRQC